MVDKATMRQVKEHLQGIINVGWPEATQAAIAMNNLLSIPDWPQLEQDKPAARGCRLQPWADPTLCDDLGTGEQLKDLLPRYDVPDKVAFDRGQDLLEFYAVKWGLVDAGFILDHMPPQGSRPSGWHRWPAGVPVPSDWRGLRPGAEAPSFRLEVPPLPGPP